MIGPNRFYEIMTREEVKTDFLSPLPVELKVHIQSFLELPSKLSLSMVCIDQRSIFISEVKHKVLQHKNNFPKLFKRIKPIVLSIIKDESTQQFLFTLFAKCQTEFNRLFIDYDVPKNIRRSISKTKDWIQQIQDEALCDFARNFIGNNITCRDDIQKEAIAWRKYLARHSISLMHLPIFQKYGKHKLPQHIPPEIAQCKTLGSLFIEYPIKSLPPEIGQLTSLTNLRLVDTSLKTLPQEILNLTRLQTLSFRNLGLDQNSQKILDALIKSNPNLEVIDESVDAIYKRYLNPLWRGLGIW